MSIVNAILYSRKSRNTEGLTAEETLENQTKRLENYAKENGYNILDTFEEVASSVDEEREQLNKMMKYIESGKVDVVIISAIDRIARSLGIFEKFLQVCKDNDVLIETPQSKIDLSNEGSELLAMIQSVLAKSEYGNIKRRLTEGKLATVSIKKRWIGSTAPFGYKYDRDIKTLVVDEELKPVYLKMVELALDGNSYSQIAKKLNDLGYRSRKGNAWNPARLEKILTNRTYLGESEYNSATLKQRAFAKETHEALISESDFNKIRKLIDSRNNFTDRSVVGKEKTIIDGLVYCGKCKRKRSIQIQKTTHGRARRTPFYAIRSCHHFNEDGSRCKEGGCKSEYVENTVMDYLKKYTTKLKKEFDKIANSTSTEQNDMIKSKIQELEKILSENKDSSSRLLDAYMRKIINIDEFEKAKLNLEKQNEIASYELTELKNTLKSTDVNIVKKSLSERINLIDEVLTNDNIPISEVNMMLKKIIKRIEVYKELNTVGSPYKVKVFIRDLI